MGQTSESQLAYLGFQLINPQSVLQPFIRSYWSLHCEKPLDMYSEELIHPQGGFGVIFNFGDPLHIDGQIISEPIFLDATNTISRKIGFLGHVEVLGIRFREGGAYPFFGVPLNELRNAISILDAVDRISLMQLYNQLHERKILTTRTMMLESWLVNQLTYGKQRDPIIPATILALQNHTGKVSIPNLADQFSISQRHLERLYQTQVGMSPKQYIQLLRIDAARQAIKIQRPTAELAVDLGFYDQAHFIREFRAVVGITPTVYKRRNRT